jgi:hypothetical protein
MMSTTGRIKVAEVSGRRRVGFAVFLAMALLVTVTTMGFASQPASASAYGCVSYGPSLVVSGIRMPKGTFCHYVNGSGTYVNYVYAQANVNNAIFGTTCNYRVEFAFRNGSGQTYQTFTTPIRYTCFSAAGMSERINLYRHMQRGSVCATLISNGFREATQCHSIY